MFRMARAVGRRQSALAGTLPEEVPQSGEPTVRLLVHVLGYEDLLAEATTIYRIDAAGSALAIGRAADDGPAGLRGSELFLRDRWMSSAHARLERTADGDVLSDGGSRNGTFVGGERITSKHQLIDGDLIEVGHSLLCYRVVTEADALALGSDADPALHGPTRTYCAELASAMRAL